MSIAGKTSRRRRLAAGLAAAVMMAVPAAVAGPGGSAAAAPGSGDGEASRSVSVDGSAGRDGDHGRNGRWAGNWAGTWSTAMHHPTPGNEWTGPNWSVAGFDGQSVRQVVRVSTGGPLVRIRLSNRFGTRPLHVTGATIGKAGEGAAVRPGTVRRLSFDHRKSTTIPAGGTATSDATVLWTRPLDKLSITLYFDGPTGPATFHEGGLTTTYRADGDHRYDRSGKAYAGETTHSWYYLTGVDVRSVFRPQDTVVAFGDSITDGYGSTPNTDDRYPDELAERLVDAGRRLGVVNAGINGNKVLADSTCYGERGVTRFTRDALGQPGVRTAIVLLGINDIGGAGFPDQGCGTSPVVTAEQIIEGHRAIIEAAHERGVTVIGGTLTPIKGSFYYTEANEKVRDAVNEWIRTSGEYDAVVDFDRALADPDDPDAMRPEYAAPDLLHPNDAGMKAMAGAIDLRTL